MDMVILWAAAFFWLGLAFVTGVAAGERGRSFFGWLLLGLPFPILALLTVLVLRPRT